MREAYNIVSLALNDDHLDPSCWRKISELCSKLTRFDSSSVELYEALKSADILLVRYGMPIPKEMIAIAPKLKFINVYATDVGKIDLQAAREAGVVVSNLRAHSANAVAEFAVASILDVYRDLREGHARAARGETSEVGIFAREIKGKQVGVIGFGAIGTRIAEICGKGFGATVSYWSRTRKAELENDGCKYSDLDFLISSSDILALSIPLSPQTEGFMNANRIASMKQDSLLINISPMGLIDRVALKKRLAVNDIYFSFDHIFELSNEERSEFVSYKNTRAFPTIAYITQEARQNRQRLFMENLEGFLVGQPRSVVS